MREKMSDALLGAAIKSIEELEALVSMLESFNTTEGSNRVLVSSKLREIADLLDRLPLMANDLGVIKKRLRGMLSSDPDKTPRAISVKDIPAVTLEVEGETRLVPVEDVPPRKSTYRGLGIPLPKKG